jgi:hypothetical protein
MLTFVTVVLVNLHAHSVANDMSLRLFIFTAPATDPAFQAWLRMYEFKDQCEDTNKRLEALEASNRNMKLLNIAALLACCFAIYLDLNADLTQVVRRSV